MRVERFGGKFALMMFDIDHFKLVNDTYGHDVGDVVLKEFSRLIRENIREVDRFGRWGGEEFMLFAQAEDEAEVVKFANKLRLTIQDHIFPTVHTITVSIGIDIYSGGYGKEELIKRVDEALYDAKEGGRNRAVLY